MRLDADGTRAVLAQRPQLQGAMVVMEPQTGRVLALVGGYDWVASQFDRATQAKRQVGSSIKPFIYSAALEAGKTPVDHLIDGPYSVQTATGVWTPANFGNQYFGDVTLMTALAFSLNTISVQLAVQVGLDRIIEIMRGYGITSPIPRHISISLGTPDLTLLELAGAYAGIASGGHRVTPRFYDLVTDTKGTVIADLRHLPQGPQVISPEVDYVMINLMKGVVQRGTARYALALGRPTAGKTGTSANYKDVWFNGFTTDLLASVWIGRDDSTPIGDQITGGGAAVPIWLDFMQKAHPAHQGPRLPGAAEHHVRTRRAVERRSDVSRPRGRVDAVRARHVAVAIPAAARRRELRAARAASRGAGATRAGEVHVAELSMKLVVAALVLATAPAFADDDDPDWAFCTKPCSPSPTTTHMLEHDELHGSVICKHGTTIGIDAKQRLVQCTTARALDLGGLPVAADTYTIFHTNGRIYQTTTRTPISRTLANGMSIACATGLVSLNVDGFLEYCTLARPLGLSPHARVGQGISFHRDGRIAGITLDETFKTPGITWPAGTTMMWTEAGVPKGGSVVDAIQVGELWLTGEFSLHPDGKLRAIVLAKPATVKAHVFPERAKLEFRTDRTLERAEFVSAEGFMIHGEQWTDTTHQTFDAKGAITSSTVTHFQSDVRPSKR